MFGAPLLPRTLSAALRDLHSSKVKMRVEAVRDLARHEGSARAEVVSSLEGSLRDAAGEVRATAATALADIKGREALAALVEAMNDASAEVRQMVVAAVGEIAEPGDVAAIEELRRALSDARPEVRFQAVIAYPRLASRDEAQAVLLKASNDEDTFVCHIALRMAEELAEEHSQIAESLLTRARALLTRGAPMVRVASAILLARVAPEESARAVHEVLVAVALGELSTPDAEDEATVIELCGDIGLADALPGLERRAFGRQLLVRNRFAWHARVALARMGHERARREIMSELSARNRDRRTLAVAAVGRARIEAARESVAAMRGDADRADQHAVDEALRALTQAQAE